MTSALKNRLVGTIIVVALAVIFLPDFLDGKKQTNREPFVSVPANPPKKPIVEPESFPSERVAKAAVPAVEIQDETALDDDLDSLIVMSKAIIFFWCTKSEAMPLI